MAITLSQKQFAINISNIVNSSINAVQKVRQTEQARKEAEFQRAIADGMSYEDQIAFRQKQRDEESASSFADESYLASLDKSITETKQLNRFNKYRTKYAQILGDLAAGKINEEKYLATLQSSLIGIDDPDLRLEIQKDIAGAQAQVKTYTDTILSNNVKKAQSDGTVKSLNSAIERVKAAKTEALVAGKEDDAGVYDQTIAALNSQLSTVKIQDSLTGFQVNSATKGVNPLERLSFINDQAKNADSTTPIKIGDRSYASAQQYWQQERDSFLSGTSQVFGNFFKELDSTVQDNIDSNTAKFGYPTQAVLDNTLKVFDDLRQQPELAPYLPKLDVTQANVITKAVDKTANKIIAFGENNLSFKDADIQLQNLSKKYGVDTTGYSMKLQEQVNNQLYSLQSSGRMSSSEALSLMGEVNIPLPKIELTKPTETTTETKQSAGYVVKSGDTLSAIAKGNNLSLSELLAENPELQKNPNLITVGQNIKLPGTTQAVEPQAPAATTPAAKPQQNPAVKPEPVTVNKPVVQAANQPVSTAQKVAAKAASNQNQMQTPAPAPVTVAPQTPAPVQPAPAQQQNYNGTSIVDYLKTSGQDTSFSSRLKLATEKGIKNYAGTAEQNTQLLKLLKG